MQSCLFPATARVVRPASQDKGLLPPVTIACRHIPGPSPSSPIILYLPGLLSTWGGLKSQVLEAEASSLGLGYLSLHYQGHGGDLDHNDADENSSSFISAMSSGNVENIESLEEWLMDIEAVLDAQLALLGFPKLIIVGSSLGAWLGLLLALRRPALLGGLVLLAPAVDASRRWARLSRSSCGPYIEISSNYIPSGDIRLNVALMDDANERWLLLEGPGKVRLNDIFEKELQGCPVHIFAGEFDEVVPMEEVERLAAAVPRAEMLVVQGSDHRLSQSEDLDMLVDVVRTQAAYLMVKETQR